MATTKTLTPTNQAITLAAFTEKPDNRTNVTNDDKLADAVNALNSKFTPMDFNLEGKTVFTGDVLTLDPGTYRVSNASTNLPAANNFNMMVIQRNENWKTIIALSDANLIYTNTKNNGTWMGWSQLTSIIETVITRTTSSEGNIILTNADVAYKTPIFSSLSGVSGFVGVCSISRYSGSWVIHVADTNGNAKSNTEFTVSIRCV